MCIYRHFRRCELSIKFIHRQLVPYPKRSERTMDFFKISPEAAAQAQCLARLHHEARRQARLLRAEAVDNFWRGANEVLCSTWACTLGSVRRIAQRLGHALVRHRGCRSANPSAPVSTVKGN